MSAIEHAGREVIIGLIEQIMDLTHPTNDTNPAPWSEVENKAYEIVRVAQAVQDGILRRGVQRTLPFEEVP
jgi:hypothetical protein